MTATTSIPAPFFLIDVAALFPELFVLGDSLLGGDDVLGDTQYDVLASVSVANDFFPPFPRVIVSTVGISASPTTGLLTAISGQVFAFVAGSQVQFNGVTAFGSTFSINAVYSGATNVFIG
jgi:hypothetical protein